MLFRNRLPVALVVGTLAAGCGQTGSAPVAEKAPATTHDHDHGHAHPTEGPHHGDLVELGNEEFHAEVVHGAGGAVTVYILDGAATATVPVDAAEVVFNVSVDGNPEQFSLKPEPQDGESNGKSSRFSLTSEPLAKHLDDGKATAKLAITIAGKPYSGKVEHHHDHDHAHK